MEPKKNPALDVHSYRPALLAGSLAISILTMIGLFEWTVVKRPVTSRVMDTFSNYTSLPLEFVAYNIVEERAPPRSRVLNPNNIVEVNELSQADVEAQEFVSEPEAQAAEEFSTIEELPVEVPEETEFVFVEKMPEPEGGLEGFYKTLKRNLKYPGPDARRGIEGKVFVEFTVSKTGQLTNLKIVRGISEACDKEALRVLALTKWQPGKQRGVPVNVKMVQAIHFQLHQ
jgi:periplasmic protein TonB